MPIVSYAQNFEDVILWRALNDIKEGFYVDVGAMDPEEDSVTKAFYDAGWNGVNVEPLQQNYEKFLKQRPRDININLLSGDHSGDAIFYELVNTGLSTQNKTLAEELSQKNGFPLVERNHKIETLTNILKGINPPTIHFLKIDVEGAEEAVLKGTDLELYRPWIIVIEATIPLSQTQNYSSWEPYLLANSYDFAYFDGLNRFYVAHEKQDLMSKVSIPPNVFDQFITIRELSNKRETYAVLQLAEKIDKSLITGFNQQQVLLESNLRLANENTHLQETVDSLSESLLKVNTEFNLSFRQLNEAQAQQQVLLESNLRLANENTHLQETVDSLSESLLKVNTEFNQSFRQLNEAQAQQLESELSLKKVQEENSSLILKNKNLSALETQIDYLNLQNSALQTQIAESAHARQEVLDELIQVYSSKSFRLTRPFRSLARLLRKAGGKHRSMIGQESKQQITQYDKYPTDPEITDDTSMAGLSSKEEIAQFDKYPIDPEITDDTEYFCGILKDLKRDNR
jgi:FkbM family methyltransferase